MLSLFFSSLTHRMQYQLLHSHLCIKSYGTQSALQKKMMSDVIVVATTQRHGVSLYDQVLCWRVAQLMRRQRESRLVARKISAASSLGLQAMRLMGMRLVTYRAQRVSA